MNDRAQSLIKKLTARGINPIKVDEGTATSDPAIWITETVYIQIGATYTTVFSSSATGLSVYESSGNIKDVIDKLKQAIDKT